MGSMCVGISSAVEHLGYRGCLNKESEYIKENYDDSGLKYRIMLESIKFQDSCRNCDA